MLSTKKIYYKSDEEVTLIGNAAKLVSKTLAAVAQILREGISTFEIELFCKEFIGDHGAIASFLNYRGYPYHICASVNDVVVHGFPNSVPLRCGDIVSLDLGVILNGWHGDHAYTFMLGTPTRENYDLVNITKESLYLGLKKATTENRLGDVSWAIQEHTEKKNGYGVVRDLVGHGLGKSLHEEPKVPNYGKRGDGLRLRENLVLAIEPMINLGTREVYTLKDRWTVKTKDHKVSAHFEHDVCVKKSKSLILSDYAIIESAEQKNINLTPSKVFEH